MYLYISIVFQTFNTFRILQMFQYFFRCFNIFIISKLFFSLSLSLFIFTSYYFSFSAWVTPLSGIRWSLPKAAGSLFHKYFVPFFPVLGFR